MVGFCHLTDSHHNHHGQKPTMVGTCHGGNMLGNQKKNFTSQICVITFILQPAACGPWFAGVQPALVYKERSISGLSNYQIIIMKNIKLNLLHNFTQKRNWMQQTTNNLHHHLKSLGRCYRQIHFSMCCTPNVAQPPPRESHAICRVGRHRVYQLHSIATPHCFSGVVMFIERCQNLMVRPCWPHQIIAKLMNRQYANNYAWVVPDTSLDHYTPFKSSVQNNCKIDQQA